MPGHFKEIYKHMGQSSKTFLLIVSITTLFTGFCGAVSDVSHSNWFDAQMHCRQEGKLLSNLPPHMLYNESYFWTRHCTRWSEWIKIIGCYQETAVNTLTKKSNEMHFPSAGLCQEVCILSNYSVFGVQFNRCVCLEEIPRQRSRGANDCSSSCSEKYSNETNVKFQKDCGGQQTYSLFKSGSEMENSAFPTSDCLSLQCTKFAKLFIGKNCGTDYAQICNKTLYLAYGKWHPSSSDCKSKHNSYLLGDVNLTDPWYACNLIQEQPEGPSWIGIAKELYISADGVKYNMVQTDKNPIRCLKCNSNNCIFADCSEFNYFVCMERPGTTSNTPTSTTKSTSPHETVLTSSTPIGASKSTSTYRTVSASITHTYTTTSATPHGSVSTEQNTISIFEATEGSTNKKNENMMNNQDGNTTVIMVVVPVTVIIILGLIALLLVIFWRRQIKKTTETKHAQHEPSLPNHSEKSNTDHALRNNYFVLDKTETYSVVNSTNHADNKSCRSPHNESYDDDYDHLGGNLREEEKEEDNYHHAFFHSNEEESYYGIKNISDECKVENPYSHTNTGRYHVALEDNDYNTISINA